MATNKLIPNVSKLEVGMEFATFKDLVAFVELPFSDGGPNRIYMERKLKQYFNYEHKVVNGKKKRALIITEIY